MSDDLRTRDRHENRPTSDGSGSGEPNGRNLAEMRERAEQLSRVGSGIARSILGNDSERFLDQSRQQGGQ